VPVLDKTGEFETTPFREIVQIKQNQIISIFRCQVIETIVSQYCGHCSSAGVTWNIRFREPKGTGSLGMQEGKVTWQGHHRRPHNSGHDRVAVQWTMTATASRKSSVSPTEKP
jgi:hypothetical protein